MDTRFTAGILPSCVPMTSRTNAAGAARKNGNVGTPKPATTPAEKRQQPAAELGKAEDRDHEHRDNGGRFHGPGDAEGDPAREDATARAGEPVAVEHERGAGEAEQIHHRLEQAAADRV
jgi:hypothetical protein